jgi:two-component system OmpR family sensor kinase
MSLRARVLLGLGVIALVFGITAVLIPRITAAHLVEQVDDQLEAVDGPFGPDLDHDLDEPSGPPDDGGDFDRPSRVYLARIDATGEVADTIAPNYGDTEAPSIDVDQVLDEADQGPFTVDGDTRYRMAAHREGDEVVVVGLPLDDVDATVSRLIRIEIAALVAVLAVLGLVAWWVIRLGVRPVKEMAAAATEIGAGDLSARVPEHDPATEAGQLGVALNQMLGRIEDEFDQRLRSEQRLRQFAADASHELRTPVTTVRGYAELYRTGALEDPGELTEAMRRVEQESVRMGSLVDDLLRLARLDQGRELERGPVDLAVVVADAARDAQATAPDRPITVEADGPVVVQGDERQLRQVVSNLTANALLHTEPGVAVTLRARLEDQHAVIEVHDEGPGMAPEVAARVFERFYRADPSRSRHTGGSGLGLAIVDATIAAHGGEVTVDTGPGRGTTFRATIPLA